jgi:hypothetical protein
MNLLRTILATALLCTSSAIGQEIQDGSGDFVPLFNGRDFTGWVRTNTPESTWSYQDDLIVCTGKPIGEIRTEKMYQNFILEVEWRHMVPGGNAGIFLFADDITARGVPFHRGIEVQVLENAYGNTRSHTTHGDIFPIHGATMVPVNGRGGDRAFPTENRSNPSPEWNHYRITAIDGEVTLAVNGKVVTQGRQCSPRKGYICLESEGGVVHYRNVKLRELPDSPLPAAEIAIANRGFASIYTGLDLSGWQVQTSPPSASDSKFWQARDWVLAYVGPPAEPNAKSHQPLVLDRALENFGFVVDFKLNQPESTFALELIHKEPGAANSENTPAAAAVFATPNQAPSRVSPGQWHRLEGTVVDSVITLSLDGQPLESAGGFNNPTGKCYLRLSPSDSVDFANLYLRPIH